MSDERETDERDELVSEAYRGLGAQTAPEGLNQTILRLAESHVKRGGTSGFLFAAWMKPVAWAATIGVSLAIVLEVTRVPTASLPSVAVPAAESFDDEFKAQGVSALEEAPFQQQKQSEPKLEEVIVTKEAANDDVEILNRELKGKVDAVAAPAAAAPARKRAADKPVVMEQNLSLEVLSDQVRSDNANSCDKTARQSASGWLKCIDDLRQSGAAAAADLEYEAFSREYPVESADLEPNK